MTICSFSFKIPVNKEVWDSISVLSTVVTEAAQELLDQHWTNHWIDKVTSSSYKSYKIIGEEKVQVVKHGRMLYIPSRIRRCITEWVGRTLRSQSIRKNCFDHIKAILHDINIEQNLDTLVSQIFYSIKLRFGVYYKHQIIRQLLRMMRRWIVKYKVDIMLLDYTSLIHPKLINFTFPYGPDDHQALRLERKKNNLEVALKLPRTELCYTPKDWNWYYFTLPIPDKLCQKLPEEGKRKPKKPDLRYKRLKSGLLYPILQVPWEYTDQKIDYMFYHKKRVLAIDLGLVNLATSVICEAGFQITRPIFYKRSGILLRKVEHLYELQSNIQKKLQTRKTHAPGQKRRRQELSRIHAKLTRKRKEEVSLLVNHIIHLAQSYGCPRIALEDLRDIVPPKGMRKWSRRLNNWFHGTLYEVLDYKAKLLGIKIKRVNPRGTSSYCPRCGKKGTKVVDSESQKESKFGRFFYCPCCFFMGDRDYIGALNVYRLYESYIKKNYSLVTSRTVLYKSIGLPLNRSSGTILR